LIAAALGGLFNQNIYIFKAEAIDKRRHVYQAEIIQVGAWVYGF
jgi:hypothetical protein